MLGMLWKVGQSLSSEERYRGVLLILMMTALAAVEVAGIVSVTPFLLVLGNPKVVDTNSYLSSAFVGLGFSDRQNFLIFLAGVALGALIFASAIRIMVQYVEARYVNMRRNSIATRVLRTYLHQPYAFFLQRNSSDMSKTILSEVDELINNALAPALRMFSYGLVALAITVLLIVIDPFLAFAVASLTGGMYLLIYWGMRNLLERTGKERQRANKERFRAVAETLGGIKELKILGQEGAYLEAFRQPSIRFSRYQATHETMAEAPKNIMEAVGFLTMFFVSLYLLAQKGEVGQALPTVGLYAFAGFRLLPAAHKVFSAIARLRFVSPAVEAVLRDIEAAPEFSASIKPTQERLLTRRAIRLENVDFTYAGATSPTLSDINLTFPAGSVTAIVGTTGAGKSTLTDLILGLLHPTNGRILVDDVVLDRLNIRMWQNNIGYVPQSIFLVDDTIARNIAFGIDEKNIDRDRLIKAAQIAQIHDFIVGELPQGYSTVIGERGARLSGGQRQRLGIARALYNDPGILIFDEATNALDKATEAEVLAAIQRLDATKTVLVITHRLATVECFDAILKLEHGRVEFLATSYVTEPGQA